MELVIETVGTGWSEILELFKQDRATRIATRHGISFDIAGLTLVLTNPNDRTPPDNFPYPELIADYMDRMFGQSRDSSLLFQRMHRWNAEGDDQIDQIGRIRDLLRRDRNSRSAVFSLWNPTADLSSDYPVSPVSGCFRLMRGRLNLFITARSADVVLGLVPELLAFSYLLSNMALELGVATSVLSYHAWSAHMYEVDYISLAAGG